ncbi:MAG: lytic transglycosylase domain-containing protein [Patescibacteria group bacterium]|nr:lytic transglycosylase domain-containing protein [Patescibacteria group bacterium]
MPTINMYGPMGPTGIVPRGGPAGDVWMRAREAGQAHSGVFTGYIGRAILYINQAVINVQRGNINLGGMGGFGGGGGGSGGGSGGIGGLALGGLAGGGFLNGITRLGMAGFSVGILTRLGFSIAKDIIGTPFIMGRLWSGVMQAAGPYFRLQAGAYAIGRAGAGSGQALLRSIFPGGGLPGPAWMRAFGGTPESVLQGIQGLSVLPRNKREFTAAGQATTMSPFLPGFAGISPGMINRIQNQGLTNGFTNLQNLRAYSLSFAEALDPLFPKGIDRSEVLGHIADSIDQIAKSGAPLINRQALMQGVAQSTGYGTAAARTGQAGMDIATSFAEAMQNPWGNVFRGMVVGRWANIHHGFRSRRDITQALGLSDNPTNAELSRMGISRGTFEQKVTDILQASSGPHANAFVANTLMANLAAGSQTAEREMANLAGPLSGLPLAGAQTMGIANLLGQSYATADVARAQASGNIPPMNFGGGPSASAGNVMKWMTGESAVPPSAMHFQSGVDYASIIRARYAKYHVPEATISTIIATARRHNLNPLILASIAAKESSFYQFARGPYTRYGEALGLMGIMTGYTGKTGVSGVTGRNVFNLATNVDAGATLLEEKLRMTHGDLGSALALYNGHGPAAREYALGRLKDIGQATLQLPDYLKYQYQQGMQQTTQAAYAATYLVPVVSAAQDAFNDLIQSINKVIGAIGAFARGPASAPASMPPSQ